MPCTPGLERSLVHVNLFASTSTDNSIAHFTSVNSSLLQLLSSDYITRLALDGKAHITEFDSCAVRKAPSDECLAPFRRHGQSTIKDQLDLLHPCTQ